jgi:hypothetical protein
MSARSDRRTHRISTADLGGRVVLLHVLIVCAVAIFMVTSTGSCRKGSTDAAPTGGVASAEKAHETHRDATLNTAPTKASDRVTPDSAERRRPSVVPPEPTLRSIGAMPEEGADRRHREGRDTATGIPVQAAKSGEPDSTLPAPQFVDALGNAIEIGDANAIRSILEKVPQDASLTDELKGIMNDPNAVATMQRCAAEALVRIGTSESVQYVLGQLLVAYRSGDSDRANTLLAALEAPTTAEGMKVLFDFLLGRGNFARTQETLPAEAVAATRKALLAAPDRAAVGNLAASLYLDPSVMSNNVAMWELFDGVSHPLMLAHLATRAYQENLPENAGQFLDRLGKSDDQSAVQAVVQMVPNQAVPLNDAAMALYDWSLAHQQAATPGLFIEYMTDQTLPPEQRSVAAFGLAGSSNREYAQQALEKALALETDAIVRTNLQTALTILTRDRSQK